MTNEQLIEERKFTPTVEWKKDGTGAWLVERNLELGAVTSNPVINTAHNTYMNLIAAASMPSGKTFHLKELEFTNVETYDVRIEIFDDTTLIKVSMCPAGATVSFDKNSLIGKRASTSLRYRTQSGSAWSAGTYVDASGYYIDT